MFMNLGTCFILMQNEENEEEINEKRFDFDERIKQISEINEKDDLNIEEIISNLFQSFEKSKKEDCIRSLCELYVCLTYDDDKYELEIQRNILDNELFIDYMKKILEIEDNETFQLCSLILYVLTTNYSSFCNTLYDNGFIAFFLEKLKEFNPNNSLLIFQIFINTSKNNKDVLNFLIFSDIFDILIEMLDQEDIDITKNPIIFLKSFLEIIINDEQYKEIISLFIQKIYDILKRSVEEENEIILNICLLFLSEFINSAFLEDIISYLFSSISLFPLQCINLTINFFLQLIENHLLIPDLIPQFDVNMFYSFIYDTKDLDDLILNTILFLTELTKFQGELVQNIVENFNTEQFLDVIQSKSLQIKIAGAQFICSMIVNLEIIDPIYVFINEEIIDFLREIDKIERNKNQTLNINGAFTKLYMAIIDEENPIKEILSKFIF